MKCTHVQRCGGLALPAIVLTLSGHAWGQSQDTGALAETLFRSARQLMAAGHYDEACPKLRESLRIDPKLGTLLNLALCDEKVGKSASAWAEYTRAAELARRAGESERERVATEQAAHLEPTLPHLVIDLTSQPPGLDVRLDDESIGTAALATPIPVDPGTHVLRATAPGKKAFSETIDVGAGDSNRTVLIPALEDEPSRASPPVPSAPIATPPAPAAPSSGPMPSTQTSGERSPSTRGGARRALGWTLVGGGIVLAGLGSYFGVLAFASKRTADGDCNATVCTQPGLDAIHSMKVEEATSTLTIGAGLLAALAGAYFLLSGDGSTRSASALPQVGLHVTAANGGGLSLRW